MQKAQRKNFYKERVERLPLILLTVITLILVCFIVAPIDIYANNLDEFNFSLSDFFGVLLLFSLIILIVFGAVLFFLPKNGYKGFLTFLIATDFLLIIQQNYLNFGFNYLPGDNMDSTEISTGLIILDTAIWLIVYVVAYILAFRKIKIVNVKTVAVILSVVMLSMQVVSPITNVISHSEMFTPKMERIDGELKTATIKNYSTLASEKNIYYFCIDRFDERYAEDAYEKNPSLFNALNGFTWFQDNISVYGHTFPGVVNMLTNKEYDSALNREEFLDGAYEGDTPLKLLNDLGYEINLYTQPYYAYSVANKLPDFVANVSSVNSIVNTAPVKLPLYITYASVFRGLPLLIKNSIGFGSSAEFNSFIIFNGKDGDKTFKAHNIDTRATYYNLKDLQFTDSTANKKFTFLHVEGCHAVDYDDNFNKITMSKNMYLSVNNSFKIINTYIEQLKQKGLYDSATIIITGDHATPENNVAGLTMPARTALFFKPSGNIGSFTVNNKTQSSHRNIWATILKSEGVDYSSYGDSIFDLDENVNQTRIYTWHTYTGDLDEYQYEIKGSGSDFKNWQLKNKIHYDKFLMS